MLDITFVIPALNEEILLPSCLRSIRSEAPGAAIIVVDNGSEDRTAEVALSFPNVTVIHEKEKGITKARQAGLLAARTEWIACIDADSQLPDMWYLFATRELWYAKRDGIVALSGPIMYNELLILTRLLVFVFYVFGRLLHVVAPMVQGGNCILNREALLRVGGFNIDVDFYGEDTATAKRLSQVGNLKFRLGFFCFGSARRFAAEGFLLTGARYALNYLWIWIVGHPLNRTHRDHREPS